MNNRFPTAITLIYPTLLALFPVLALRNNNLQYTDLATILRAALLVTLATLLIQAAAFLLFRHIEKAALISSILVISFLTYGHVYAFFNTFTSTPIRHSYLVGGYTLLLAGILGLILRREERVGGASSFLAVTSIVLLSMAMFTTLRYDLRQFEAAAAAAKNSASENPGQAGEELPDVYFILLDAHGRSDVLRGIFGYDNSQFVNELQKMGFYVAECAQSNYASTKLSLSSAMYASYIDEIIGEGQGVLPPLETSLLNQALKARGYTTITFENRARGHFNLNEDVRLARNQLLLGEFDLRGGINEFEEVMIDSTFLRFLLDTELIPGFDRDTLKDWENREHFAQTNYILSKLEELPFLPGRKFVFAHIMVPHSPFIFSPDGVYQPTSDPIQGYANNTAFIDGRLPSVLAAILEKSDPSPVIIIIGDHGPAPDGKTITREARMEILATFFVSDKAKSEFYPNVTPINAIRIIYNEYFGGALPLLEDHSYYAYQLDQVSDAEEYANNCSPASE